MNIKLYYVAAGVVGLLIVGTIAGHLWSSRQIRRLEETVEAAKTQAAQKEIAADNAEKAAAEYKQKIDYLETNLADVRELAEKQDEELQKLTTDTRNARRDVRDARRVRAVSATNEELCAKLTEVGHPCQ